MTKKIISVLLTVFIALSLLCCCVPTEHTDPTQGPTEQPTTQAPTEQPTQQPTEQPTQPPTDAPTEPPTEKPTQPPTDTPTEPPTEKPTQKPTEPPTEKPTERPTEKPTDPPTEKPTERPTEKPTEPPTEPTTEPPTDPIPDAELAEWYSVSNVFDSNMVLQRNEKITVWGTARDSENGKRLTAEFAGMKAETIIRDGKWSITFPETLPANNKGQTLYIRGAEGFYDEFTGILIGDVYWVIGQSNIDYSISTLKSEAKKGVNGQDIVITNRDNIRLHRNSFKFKINEPQGTAKVFEESNSKYGWQMPERGAAEFSALGYFFGKQIIDATNNEIPIGLVEFEANGHPIATFFPNELANKMKIDRRNSEGIYQADSVIGTSPTRFMYNQFMYSMQNLKIAGIVWYQGESDCLPYTEQVYSDRLSALITEYRNRHDQINHDYPVYIIEFPTNFFGFDFGAVRGRLAETTMKLKNSYVAASLDIWTDRTYGTAHNQLHPYCKWDQAKRASDMALAITYGIGDIDKVAGPHPVSVTISGGTATIKYDHTASGLTLGSGSELIGFQVMVNGSWQNASAEIISADTVRVTSFNDITAVRYGCIATDEFNATVNLANSEGVPAVSFVFEDK